MKNRYYKIKSPTRVEKWVIRTMVYIGFLSIIFFFYFFFQSEYRGYLPLYILLSIVLIYGACRNMYLWYHYYSISVPKRPKSSKERKVDILTTYFPGEPYAMVIKTLKAIQKIEYPHTTYLCDEANDAFLKEQCKQLGVIHVTRNNRIDAKAGNINNALKQATGEICVILDPDHIPQPNFLKAVLPYFENEQIGFVQIVQGYYNKFETLVARGAAEQTFQFYGPMMMTMNSYGTVNAIGANCTFRRSALDSIGGHAPGLAEDMHTAMLLHAKGWKSVYVPEFLAKGLVPADLTSYYKQQLKWSRGTFELLYSVYPKLFSKFTLRQKIHYALLPFHYFIGFIYLLAFLIPILSLFLSKMPWTGDIFYFIALSIPVFMSSFLIRTFIQKWVIEANERGFHIMGGLLQIVSWWVYLLGIVYTLVRKKVPYLPTPKDEQTVINFKILIPNLLVGVVSILAIIIGLTQDFTPFSLVMSLFAAINAGFMFFSYYLASSVTNRNRILRTNLENQTIDKLARLKKIFRNAFHGIFTVFRPITLPVLLLSVWFSVYAINTMVKNKWENIKTIGSDFRDFRYLGIFEPSDTSGLSNLKQIEELEHRLGTDFQIVSYYLAWGDSPKSSPDQEYLSEINKNGSFPMITWEPWASGFVFSDSIADLKNEKRIFQYINQGLMDTYITNMALALKDNGEPVFLRFAHEFDNPSYPWSKTGYNTPSDFKEAWKHVHKIFAALEVDNVIWVWNPWHTEFAMDYYPGDQYVDWIGTTLLNYGILNDDQNWYAFKELYQPFHDIYKDLEKPVMLTEFGSLALGGSQQLWFSEALNDINDTFDEIKGIVFFNSRFDKNIPQGNNDYLGTYLDWSFDISGITQADVTQYQITGPNPTKKSQEAKLARIHSKNPFKKPYKGVSYKKSNNWSNNYYIASKHVLENDFKLMKRAGIDLVNLEHSKIYEYNLLKYAEKNKLKVNFSFWIPNDIDFLTDHEALSDLKKQILQTILRLNDNKTVIGWTITNDLWIKSNDLYDVLVLGEHQKAYLAWLQSLTEEIKEIDPKRPLTKEVQLNERTVKQLNTIKGMDIKFDAVGISIKNLDFWEDFVSYSNSVHLPFFIHGIGVDDYVENRAGLMNLTVIIENWQNQKETGKVTFDGLLDFDGAKKPQFKAVNNLWSSKKLNYNFPEIDILRPAVPILKNRTVRFNAIFKQTQGWEIQTGGSGYQLKWYLVKNDQFDNAIAIKEVGEGNFIDLEIPEDYGKYRLLLKAGKGDFSVSAKRTLNTPLLP